MTRKIFPVFFIMLLLAGCGGPAVDYTLSDQYRLARPYTVAVLPVEWASEAPEDKDVSHLFRIMSYERLGAMGYRLVPIEAVDALYLKGGLKATAARPKPEIAGELGADGLVVVRVNGWDKGALAGYASLGMEAELAMYSMKGEQLWSADYKTSESDLSLDAEQNELAVVTAYEPRIQRFVDAVFTTLPQAEAPKSERTFFDWLP